MKVTAEYFEDELAHGFVCSGDQDGKGLDGEQLVSCGYRDDDGAIVGFISQGWPTKKAAQERFAQHKAEHETEEPAPDQALLFLKHAGRDDELAELEKRLAKTSKARE